VHVLLAGDDHIRRDQKSSKDSPETHHLPKTVIDLLPYYEKIEITTIVAVRANRTKSASSAQSSPQ